MVNIVVKDSPVKVKAKDLARGEWFALFVPVQMAYMLIGDDAHCDYRSVILVKQGSHVFVVGHRGVRAEDLVIPLKVNDIEISLSIRSDIKPDQGYSLSLDGKDVAFAEKLNEEITTALAPVPASPDFVSAEGVLPSHWIFLHKQLTRAEFKAYAVAALADREWSLIASRTSSHWVAVSGSGTEYWASKTDDLEAAWLLLILEHPPKQIKKEHKDLLASIGQ